MGLLHLYIKHHHSLSRALNLLRKPPKEPHCQQAHMLLLRDLLNLRSYQRPFPIPDLNYSLSRFSHTDLMVCHNTILCLVLLPSSLRHLSNSKDHFHLDPSPQASKRLNNNGTFIHIQFSHRLMQGSRHLRVGSCYRLSKCLLRTLHVLSSHPSILKWRHRWHGSNPYLPKQARQPLA